MSDIIEEAQEYLEDAGVSPAEEATETEGDMFEAELDKGLERFSAKPDAAEKPEPVFDQVKWQAEQDAWERDTPEGREYAAFQERQAAQPTAEDLWAEGADAAYNEQAETAAEESQQGVFAEALDRLQAALDYDDPAAAVHAADSVAAYAPERLAEFAEQWTAADPLAAKNWANSTMQSVMLAGQAQQAQAAAQEATARQVLAAAWADQESRRLVADEQRQTSEFQSAVTDELERLRKSDPSFEELAPRILEHVEPLVEQGQREGWFANPDNARAVVRSGYEQAVAVAGADRDAHYLDALDEMIHRQHRPDLVDEQGNVRPFDREAVHAANAAKLLRAGELGQVSKARQTELAGGVPAPEDDRMLRGMDEYIEEKARIRAEAEKPSPALERMAKERKALRDRVRTGRV